MDDEVEVALEAGGRVLLVRVEGRQEDAVPKGYLAHRGLANRALRDAIGFRRAPKPLPHDRVHARAHSPAALRNKRLAAIPC